MLFGLRWHVDQFICRPYFNPHFLKLPLFFGLPKKCEDCTFLIHCVKHITHEVFEKHTKMKGILVANYGAIFMGFVFQWLIKYHLEMHSSTIKGHILPSCDFKPL